MDTLIGTNTQQNQSQVNSLLVNIQSASDPAFESRIFEQIATAGTQLGRISDVLNILVLAYENSNGQQLDDQSHTKIDNFKKMYAQISQEKERRAPQRIIDTLQTLKEQDDKAFKAVAVQLKQWLNQQIDLDDADTLVEGNFPR